MKRYWPLALVVLVLAGLLWWALGGSRGAPGVHFAQVRHLTIESTVPTNGRVEPVEWGAARAEIAGVVKGIGIQRGQHVVKGEPLVTLDTSAAQSELAAALAKQQEARTEAANLAQGGREAQVSSLRDSIRSAEAAVKVAQRSYDSLSRLAKQQAATRQQVLDAADALTRAKMQLAAYQDQLRTLVTRGDITVAEAKAKDATAAVTLAQHRIDLATVRAPLAGTVYQFDLKVGAYMQPGQLVAEIGDLDQVKVIVYVDEPDLGRVKKGMPVNFTWEARPGQHWWGRVEKLPTQIVPLDTRRVGEVTTIVDNPNHELLPGVTVNATVISAVEKDVVAMPKQALNRLRGSEGVYKLSGDRLVWTPVKTGVSDINNVQILSGLGPGDRVALPGDTELKSGMTVRVLE
ncbi:MAG TPA: efflux RND transporter periplasmic adaptor subunit [Bryobacteraceae bacterium]|nr:efflux RND transporter periplasmic adaptor subunit [Bryobacteraceae bacterium]